MAKFRWSVAVTLITNGPVFQIDKPHHPVLLPSVGSDDEMMIDIHKFWFVPVCLFKNSHPNMKELVLGTFRRTAAPNKGKGKGFEVSGRSSAFWKCAASGNDLTKAQYFIACEYRIHCQQRQQGHDWNLDVAMEPYKGRWRFMSFASGNPSQIWSFFKNRRAWDGSLELWNKGYHISTGLPTTTKDFQEHITALKKEEESARAAFPKAPLGLPPKGRFQSKRNSADVIPPVSAYPDEHQQRRDSRMRPQQYSQAISTTSSGAPNDSVSIDAVQLPLRPEAGNSHTVIVSGAPRSVFGTQRL